MERFSLAAPLIRGTPAGEAMWMYYNTLRPPCRTLWSVGRKLAFSMMLPTLISLISPQPRSRMHHWSALSIVGDTFYLSQDTYCNYPPHSRRVRWGTHNRRQHHQDCGCGVRAMVNDPNKRFQRIGSKQEQPIGMQFRLSFLVAPLSSPRFWNTHLSQYALGALYIFLG